jgi:hypothetical protein
MRPDLGRLDAIAEILQIGPFLGHDRQESAHKAASLGAARGAVVYLPGKCRENPMKVFRIAAAIVLLTGPAYAQMPQINLVPELISKTPEEKEAEEARDKAYKESLKKIPDAKNTDPWGNVRGGDTPKAAAPTKPRTKTGSNAN